MIHPPARLLPVRLHRQKEWPSVEEGHSRHQRQKPRENTMSNKASLMMSSRLMCPVAIRQIANPTTSSRAAMRICFFCHQRMAMNLTYSQTECRIGSFTLLYPFQEVLERDVWAYPVLLTQSTPSRALSSNDNHGIERPRMGEAHLRSRMILPSLDFWMRLPCRYGARKG